MDCRPLNLGRSHNAGGYRAGLGIDNLVFIAIRRKSPPAQRDRARVIGLLLAMLMRLLLLASISWLVTLTRPLFTYHDLSFSARDLIMLFGGLFLLFKATVELNERLEGKTAIIRFSAKGEVLGRSPRLWCWMLSSPSIR
jgi:predicted tellurium resistance membrane protein TerC